MYISFKSITIRQIRVIMDDTLAIVGSTFFAEDKHATAVARNFLVSYIKMAKPDVILSGGAVGIDTLAVEIAKEMGINYGIYLPENKRWEPDGYKKRNIFIAEACDRLICIRHFQAKTFGSGWTANYAQSLEKPVCRCMYQPDYQIEML